MHDIYRGWRPVVDEYAGDRVFVAEAWVPNPERFAQYLRPDELHTAFNFDFLDAAWDADAGAHGHRPDAGRAPATSARRRPGCCPTTTSPGTPPGSAAGELGLRRARAATLLMLALPGGAYVYQGEELGLQEVLDIPGELRQDPIFARTGGERVGRDGCRVPLPWSGTEAPFGFGPGGTPWLPQPAAWAQLTVARRRTSDPGSTLTFYRAALRARRGDPALGDGTMTWIDAPDGVLAFQRGDNFICVINYANHPIELPAGARNARHIIGTAESPTGTLAAESAAWFITVPVG